MSPPPTVSFFPSRQGALAGQFDGISLCSRHDPLKEAARLVAQRDPSAKAVLFLGLGMAYQIEAYLQNTDLPLIIIEKEELLYTELNKERHLDTLLDSPRVSLLVSPVPESLTPFLKSLDIIAIETIPHRALCGRSRDYYDQITAVVHRWIDRQEINQNTLNRFGHLWVRNLAANLPHLHRAAPLSLLRNIFEDSPALLVGAGPSLEGLLPHMQELSQRLLIIAVDTSFRNLQAHGIEPDFLVVTDPQYWNTRHLDFGDLSKTIVISDTSTHPRALREFKGGLFLSRSPFPLAEVLEKGILDISLKSGGSVATAAWDLAMTMGCPSLYCIGLDLGFPRKQTHSRGSFFEERVNFLSHRKAGPEQWAWQALHSAPLHIGETYQGNPILSDQRMRIYNSWFSEHVSNLPDRTFNLSQMGSLIQGMEYCDPKELLDMPHRREELNKRVQSLLDMSSKQSHTEVETRRKDLIDYLERAIKPVDQAKKVAQELKGAFLEGIGLEDFLTKLDRLDKEITGEGAKEIGGFLIQPFLRTVQDQNPQGGEEIIENSIKLYTQLSQSLHYHKDIFEITLQ